MAYHSMTDDEVWAFLAASPPHTAKLATTRKDGSPHVAPIWYVVDDRSLVFTTHRASLKGRNLRRDPRAALCVDDERPPFSFASVEGTVELDEVPRYVQIGPPSGLWYKTEALGERMYIGKRFHKDIKNADAMAPR
jgi:PPOX class probable F420-dependent enzyme